MPKILKFCKIIYFLCCLSDKQVKKILMGRNDRKVWLQKVDKFKSHCLPWGHLPFLVAQNCRDWVETKPCLCKGRWKSKETTSNQKFPKRDISSWWTKKGCSQEIETMQANVNDNHQKRKVNLMIPAQNVADFGKTHTYFEENISIIFQKK